MMLESKGEKTVKMVLQLLKSLSVSSVISLDQMRRVRRLLVFELCTAHHYFPKHQLICLLALENAGLYTVSFFSFIGL